MALSIWARWERHSLEGAEDIGHVRFVVVDHEPGRGPDGGPPPWDGHSLGESEFMVGLRDGARELDTALLISEFTTKRETEQAERVSALEAEVEMLRERLLTLGGDGRRRG